MKTIDDTIMKISIIVALSFLLVLPIFSQESETVSFKKNEFGGHAGFTTGLGLSYRYWFSKAGIQATAIPIKVDGEFFGSVGITGLYTLKRARNIHTYLYLGNHFIFQSGYEYYTYDGMGNEYIEKEDATMRYNLGFGPGFSFGKVVNFSLMVGYGIYDITGQFNLLPAGEIGVYYMF